MLVKFESHSTDGFLLGYDSLSRAYHVLNLEANRIVETCKITLDETMPCTTPVFELAGNHELGQDIFEDEVCAGGDEDEDGTNHGPAVPPASSTSTTMVDGPALTPSTTGPPYVPYDDSEEEDHGAPAAVEGEVTSERKAL